MSRCPFEDRIDGYLLNKLDEAAAAEFEDHYFNCPACFAALTERDEIIGVLKRGGVFAPGAEALRAKPSLSERLFGFLTPRRLAAVGVVAAIAVAAVLILVPRGDDGAPQFVFTGEETLRGEAVAAVAPADAVAETPAAFEWRPIAGGAGYQVALYDGGEILWRGSSAAPRLEIPPDIRARMAAGRPYTWQVKAFSADGTMLAASARTSFRIVPGR